MGMDVPVRRETICQSVPNSEASVSTGKEETSLREPLTAVGAPVPVVETTSFTQEPAVAELPPERYAAEETSLRGPMIAVCAPIPVVETTSFTQGPDFTESETSSFIEGQTTPKP